MPKKVSAGEFAEEFFHEAHPALASVLGARIESGSRVAPEKPAAYTGLSRFLPVGVPPWAGTQVLKKTKRLKRIQDHFDAILDAYRCACDKFEKEQPEWMEFISIELVVQALTHLREAIEADSVDDAGGALFDFYFNYSFEFDWESGQCVFVKFTETDLADAERIERRLDELFQRHADFLVLQQMTDGIHVEVKDGETLIVAHPDASETIEKWPKAKREAYLEQMEDPQPARFNLPGVTVEFYPLVIRLDEKQAYYPIRAVFNLIDEIWPDKPPPHSKWSAEDKSGFEEFWSVAFEQLGKARDSFVRRKVSLPVSARVADIVDQFLGLSDREKEQTVNLINAIRPPSHLIGAETSEDLEGKLRVLLGGSCDDLPSSGKSTATIVSTDEFSFSPDGYVITYKEKNYKLTTRQAEVIRLLWRHYNAGTKRLKESFIMSELDTPFSRLFDTFKRSQLWRTLLKKKDGFVYLVIRDEDEPPSD